MAIKFFSQLSQNFMDILDDDKYYDITIEVGQDSEMKIFRAHMVILSYRSAHFRKNLSTIKNIKLPNISPNIFQIILKYIYGGILILDEIDPLDIINLLVASENLNLQEIVNYLQTYLIENKSNWMEEHFICIHKAIFQHDSFTELQNICTDIMLKYPERVFKSLDFISIPEKTLISLIKRDDLKMEEIDIWEHVLKWGLAQNLKLLPDPETWSDDDFNSMKNILQKCLPFIRFFQLPSKDFLKRVRPYKKLLKPQLYEDLMNHYLDDDDKIILTVQPARGSNVDSKLVTNKIVAYVASWIDKKENEHPIYGYTPYSSLNNPYEFELLLRGSRDGFSPATFHKLCDNKPNTVTLIRVKGTNEILGGYNPLMWKSNHNLTYLKNKDSFIFSFTFMNLKNIILSRVKDYDKAIVSSIKFGPYFGNDLYVFPHNEVMYCNYNKENYEKKIRSVVGFVEIEDYEVFQVIKK